MRYVGLTPPSCVEKAGVACFVFQVAMAVWLSGKAAKVARDALI